MLINHHIGSTAINHRQPNAVEMTGTAARAIAASTSIDGWPQHAGPWLPSRKPRWSRKCTCVVRSWRLTLAITVRTGEQYCNHKQSVRIDPLHRKQRQNAL